MDINFDDITEKFNNETLELTAKCPQCEKAIHVFVSENKVSVVCEYCGYVSVAKTDKIHLSTFRHDVTPTTELIGKE